LPTKQIQIFGNPLSQFDRIRWLVLLLVEKNLQSLPNERQSSRQLSIAVFARTNVAVCPTGGLRDVWLDQRWFRGCGFLR
ncbi:MAG: hypothetical protein KJO70_05605, partial [Gammaproteobacteria bacterium]|nr:hypothetical protein [Gammaproteobacteria bacterium]